VEQDFKSLSVFLYFMRALMKKIATIKQKVMILASPNGVYAALVDPKKHSAFTESQASGNPIVGCRFTAWDGYISGKYVELEKGKRIVQEWVTNDWPEGYDSSKLELTFRGIQKVQQY
jgi:activator of HSP90 ATPase